MCLGLSLLLFTVILRILGKQLISKSSLLFSQSFLFTFVTLCYGLLWTIMMDISEDNIIHLKQYFLPLLNNLFPLGLVYFLSYFFSFIMSRDFSPTPVFLHIHD